MDLAESANRREIVFTNTEFTNDEFLLDSPDHLSFKVPAVEVAAQTSTTDAGIQGELDQNTLGA